LLLLLRWGFSSDLILKGYRYVGPLLRWHSQRLGLGGGGSTAFIGGAINVVLYIIPTAAATVII